MEKEIKEIKKMAEENHKLIQKNAEDLQKAFKGISANAYGLEILRDYKKEAKRWFFAFLFVTILLVIVCLHHFFV